MWQVKNFMNQSKQVSMLPGIEIKVRTLLKIPFNEIEQFNKYEYILIET